MPFRHHVFVIDAHLQAQQAHAQNYQGDCENPYHEAGPGSRYLSNPGQYQVDMGVALPGKTGLYGPFFHSGKHSGNEGQA